MIIKVMVVDDEFHIREGIKKSIPWSEFSLELIGTAENGITAWELYNELKPHIILLDINMPECSGLELAHRIRAEDKNTQIIFLTGYDEFQNAKEAVYLQARDYLLKPVSYGELRDALRNAINYIQEHLQQDFYLNGLEERVHDYNEVVTDQLIKDILQQRKSLEEVTKQLLSQGIEFDVHCQYAVLYTEIGNFQQYMNQVTMRDRQLYLYAYRKLAQEVLALFGTGYTVSDSPSQLILIVKYNESQVSDFEDLLIKIAERLQNVYADYLKMSVSIGISQVAMDANHLHHAFLEAEQALEYLALIGQGMIIPFNLVETGIVHSRQLLSKELYLLSEIRVGNDGSVVKILEEWSQELQKMHLSEAKLVTSQLVIFIRRLAVEVGLEIDKIAHTNPFLEIAQCQTIDAVVSFISNYIVSIGKSIQASKQIPCIKVIEQAKQWIREHIADEVSLSQLSNYLHMSPNYLSSLFKQATGETFSQFFARVRFERAKELLTDPVIKIHEIAEMVGFTDSNYFSIAFKKNQGLTPTEFRQRYL
jgi:two-component system response regulator YesN